MLFWLFKPQKNHSQTLLTSVCDMWKMWFQINSKNLQLNLYKNI